MARTIGKKYRNMVKRLAKEAWEQDVDDPKDYVHERMPDDAYDTWEAAYSEIEGLIREHYGV